MSDKPQVMNEKEVCEDLLKTCKIKIQCQENENLEMLQSIDKKMNTKFVLCNYMINKCRQMEAERKESIKKLEFINIENAHFKSITKFLEKTINELSAHDVDVCSVDSDCSYDEVLSLEECGKTLTNELCEGKTRVEKISKKLDRAREQLTKSEEVENCLRKRLERVEAANARRHSVEAEWRLTEDRLLAELGDSRRAEDQLRAALSHQEEECRLAERLAMKDTDELRAVIAKLTDDLKTFRSAEGVLRARVDELQKLLCTNRKTPPDVPLFYSLDLARSVESQSADQSVDSWNADRSVKILTADRSVENLTAERSLVSRSTDRNMESWSTDRRLKIQSADRSVESLTADRSLVSRNADMSLESRDDWYENVEELRSLELGRGDDIQRPESGDSQLSTFQFYSEDDVTYDRKQNCVSHADSSINASVASGQTVRSMPVPKWFDTGILNKYLNIEEIVEDEDEFQDQPTVPDIHVFQLVHKYEDNI